VPESVTAQKSGEFVEVNRKIKNN